MAAGDTIDDAGVWHRRLRRFVAALLCLTGIALAPLGAWLLWLGGSPYYVLASFALLLTAVLLWRDWGRGAAAYGLFYAATTVWALWESGADAWALAPRLGLFTGLGMLLVLAKPRNKVRAAGRGHAFRGGAAGLVGCALAALLLWPSGTRLHAIPAIRPNATATGDWTSFGADDGGTRYAALDQLTPANVTELRPAWTFELPTEPRTFQSPFEAVPLKIGQAIYLCSSFGDAYALDAETGRQLWAHHHSPRTGWGGRTTCRGVAYYRAPFPTVSCPERILYNTGDAYLVALDSRTGRPCARFGVGGQVDLLEGMGAVIPGYTYPSSPPQIVRGKAVINGRVADGQFVGEPAGVIRAFDALTGRFAWAFDPGRPDVHTAPAAGASYVRGTPNSWAPMSADENLGLVYLPMGNATPDYYSGRRTALDRRYSSSVIALDAETGAPRWLFQTTHGDIWDYDVASQPVLVDLPGDGGAITPALIQATKRGEIFILDRRTGRSLTRIDERPAPASDVPGEHASPTQPFPVGVPSVAGPPLSERMMWGLTPIDQAFCRILFRQARYEGPLTPLTLGRPTIVYPGYAGGVNWGSVSIDPRHMIMVVGAMRLANYNRLLTREEVNRRHIEPQMPGKPDRRGGAVPQLGTPYGADIAPFLSPLAMPCQQPPFGTLTAIDLRTRKLLWTRPIGSAEDLGPMAMPTHVPISVGTPLTGGAVVTAGGLTFLAATVDRNMRAIETATGKELWRARLPAGGQSTAISYRSAASGRQFIAVSAGGVLGQTRKTGDYVVAFALPITARRGNMR